MMTEKSEPKKEVYSWEFYHHLVLELKKQITPAPNFIIGIGKGGLMPGIILAEQFECTLVNFGLRSYSGTFRDNIQEYQTLQHFEVLRDSNILIVDDIADTGSTFEYAVKKVKDNFCERITTASVFYKPKSIFKPDFIAREVPNDTWIVQPWEK